MGPWPPRKGGGGGGGGQSLDLLCLWRGGKSLDWTGEASGMSGLTGGRAHLVRVHMT